MSRLALLVVLGTLGTLLLNLPLLLMLPGSPLLQVRESETVSMLVSNTPSPSNSPSLRQSASSSPSVVAKRANSTYPNVHTFYYGWYGDPETNGMWMHWNHQVLPDWRVKDPPPGEFFQPPEELGSNFYPLLGPYSSASDQILHAHGEQMALAGIGNAVVSWYPVDQSDAQIKSKPGYSDSLMHKMLKIFPLYGVQVSIHLEPYEGRNENTVRRDIEYIVDHYSGPGLFLDASNRPVVFIYDSYHTPSSGWSKIFQPMGSISLRGTKYDVTAIGLYLERKDQSFMVESGFDGFYTYFGALGFTEGSTPARWPEIQAFAVKNKLQFIPSVSPGYVDTRIRPWNAVNTRSRENGKYYDNMWEAAIQCEPASISVTSFNEWHEGSQIEPARPSTSHYLDYAPHEPFYYLTRTRHWAEAFQLKSPQ